MPEQVTGNNFTLAISRNDWLDKLPAYDMSEGRITQLDQSRLFNFASPQYYPLIFGVPGNYTDMQFAALATFEDTISIEPYSYLVGITADSTLNGIEHNVTEGFKFNIYDKGAKVYISQQDLAKDANLGGNFSGLGPAPQTPAGQYWLTSPVVVTPPGQFNIEITNLVNDTNVIQIALHFAIPLNPKTRNATTIAVGRARGEGN